MLSKAAKVTAPMSEPAWKRRRDQSPPKNSGFFTPSSSRYAGEKTRQIAGAAERMEPNKKNLFQHDWKGNDISKAQDEAKRKDMELLMNRFKTVSEKEEHQPVPCANRNSPVKAV